MVRDAAKFKRDLLDDGLVLLLRKCVPGRSYVDQSPNQTRLCVRNLHRLVGAHEEKAFEPVGICGFELLIHGHQLVRYKTVQPGIVFDPRQIAIMLNCNQRICLERLQSK